MAAPTSLLSYFENFTTAASTTPSEVGVLSSPENSTSASAARSTEDAWGYAEHDLLVVNAREDLAPCPFTPAIP